MINITKDQHRKILGFAIVGYSLQFLTYLWVNSNLITTFLFEREFAYLTEFFLAIFSINLLFFLVTFIAGLIILGKKDYRYASLLFVLFCVTFFPLGTILSFYILYYLFVVTDEEEIKEDHSD